MLDSNTDINTKIDNKKAIYIVLIIIFICFIFGLALSTTNSAQEFEIIESTATRTENNAYIISGKIKQNTNNNYTGLFIGFTLYNDTTRIRETTYNTSLYLGNNIWEFSATGNDADQIVNSYKLDYIKGY